MPYLIPLMDKVLTGQIIVDDSLRQVPFGELGPLGLAKYVEAEESLEGFLKGRSAKGGMTVDPYIIRSGATRKTNNLDPISLRQKDEQDNQLGRIPRLPSRRSLALTYPGSLEYLLYFALRQP